MFPLFFSLNVLYNIYIQKLTKHEERRDMKQILEQWSGKFEVDGEIEMTLDNLKVNNGDDFHVKLLSKRREIRDDSMSARRLR